MCYGRQYDRLDLYLNYNFVDSAAPELQLRSIPLKLRLPGGRQIIVGADSHGAFRGKLEAPLRDLAYWLPGIERQSADRLHISHLLIPGRTAPLALRRVLVYLLNRLGEQTDHRGSEVLGLEDLIVQHNRSYFGTLQALAQAAPAGGKDEAIDSGAAAQVGDLARLELAFLDAYEARLA